MRKCVESLPLLRDIKVHNPSWFSSSNMRFFGDLAYYGYYGRKTGERYLVRRTNAWTDMLGSEPTAHYRINPIGENYEIEPLIDDIFMSRAEVKAWLMDN